MRSLVVLAALLLAFPLAVSAATGQWGIYADGGCGVTLYQSTFEDGQCGKQTSGSQTIYFITSCKDGKWTETEYSDAGCTQPVPDSTNTGDSGACFPSGKYFGKVVCPSSSLAAESVAAPVSSDAVTSMVESFVGPVKESNAASALSFAPLAILAAMVALIAAIKA